MARKSRRKNIFKKRVAKKRVTKKRAKKRVTKKRKSRRKNKRLTVSRKKLNYYKKKFRKFTKNNRKMRGGSKSNFTYGCKYPQNIGSIITGYANNTNPFLPDPNPLNSNIRPHVLQKGGHDTPTQSSSSSSGGYDFGLGDLLLNYNKASNFGQNIWHRYKGNKNEMPADPTHQPELRKSLTPDHNTADVPKYYSHATIKAASNTL